MDDHTEPRLQTARLLQLLAYVYLENHRSDKAIVLLQAIEALGQADAHTLAMLALAQRRSDQHEAAIQTLGRLATYKTAASLKPVICLIRAQALQALGRTDEAYAAMQDYIGLRSTLSDSDSKETR